MLKDIAGFLKVSEEDTSSAELKDNKGTLSELSESKIDELLDDAWEHCNIEREKAIRDTDVALKASLRSGYVKGIVTAIRNKAYMEMIVSEYKHSMDNAKYALSLVDDSEAKLTGTLWDIIALNFYGLGIYEKSVDATFKSLKFFEEAKYERGIAWAHHNLAMVYSNIGEYDKADREYRSSLKQFELMNYKEGIVRLCTLISQNLRKVGKHTEAMEFLERADHMTAKEEKSIQAISNNINLAITKRLLGEREDAIRYFNKAKDILDHVDNIELEAQYLYERALLLHDLGELKEAVSHLEKTLEFCIRIDSKQMKMDTTLALSRVHEDMGHSVEALKYYKQYDQLSHELLNSESIQRIHNLEVQKDIELAAREKDYEQKLREETERILKNVLPVPIVEELKASGAVKPKRIPSATALFTDFVGFTAMSSRISPEEIVSELDYCFSGFDRIMDELGIEKLKTIGDGYMAVAGALKDDENHTQLCVKAGMRIRDFMMDYRNKRKEEGKESWGVRIGIHCGPLIAGVIGDKKFAYDVWGDTVNTASRIESGGMVGEVNVSSQVRDAVKGIFNCKSIGEFEAKGKGKLPIYIVEK